MAGIGGPCPFAYRNGSGFLHRSPAGLKLLCLLFLSVAAYSSRPGLLVSALVTAALSLSGGIRPWELLRGFRPLFFLSLLVIIFRGFSPGAPGIMLGAMRIPFVSGEGFLEGLFQALRLAVSFAAGSLLFAVTTMRELRLSLAKAETIFFSLFDIFRGKARNALPRPARRSSRISLGLSLTLGFIPRFFELWENRNLACEARSCKKGARRLFLLVPLVTEALMEAAGDTAEALEARGFL